jgi:hypothetical protein
MKRNYNTDSYCHRCVWTTHPRMLTGYCLWNARCTRCGHVSDLAMVVTAENLAAFDASVAALKKRRDDAHPCV